MILDGFLTLQVLSTPDWIIVILMAVTMVGSVVGTVVVVSRLLGRMSMTLEHVQHVQERELANSLAVAMRLCTLEGRLHSYENVQDRSLSHAMALEKRLSIVEGKIESHERVLGCQSEQHPPIPMRDEYREPSLAEETKRKAGRPADLYSSCMERSAAELLRQRRLREAEENKQARREAAQIHLPMHGFDELVG